MAEHLEINRPALPVGQLGEQNANTLIEQTAFVRATPVQATSQDTQVLTGSGEPNLPLPAYPPDTDMDDIREDVKRLKQWDADGAAQDRREMEQRRQARKPEPSAADLLQAAENLFANPANRGAAMAKFQEAIKKADAEGAAILTYAQHQLAILPPFDERDPKVSKQLLDIIESGVNRRVDTRWAFAEALEKTGDHDSAEAIRKDALDIFFSMIGPEVHAAEREKRWQEYLQQQVPPPQFDILAQPIGQPR